ncbi:MAG: hypothetical protein RLZZ46_1785, partial [Bacteroidota bacterium]
MRTVMNPCTPNTTNKHAMVNGGSHLFVFKNVQDRIHDSYSNCESNFMLQRVRCRKIKNHRHKEVKSLIEKRVQTDMINTIPDSASYKFSYVTNISYYEKTLAIFYISLQKHCITRNRLSQVTYAFPGAAPVSPFSGNAYLGEKCFAGFSCPAHQTWVPSNGEISV